MTSNARDRLLAAFWAVSLVASLALRISSYLNYSHYSRKVAYGFQAGSFILIRPDSDGWVTPICPPDISWYYGVYAPDDTTRYVIVKPGKARPYWRNDGTHPAGSLIRIDGRWTYFGFAGWETLWIPAISRTSFLLLLWIPPLVLLAIAVRLIWRARLRAKRTARAQCVVCGYSLIGNTSGVCPECGTEVPTSYRQTLLSP